MIMVYGASGYIGTNLCNILDYEQKYYIRITRDNIDNVYKKINRNDKLYVIYCIYDLINHDNNIILLKSVLKKLSRYNVKSFIYLSSWVVLFDKYNKPCQHTKQKQNIEMFLHTQTFLMKNVVKIVRPSLVVGKEGKLDKFINILKHFEGSRFVHVYELGYLLFDICLHPNNYSIEHNVVSHSFYNKRLKNIIPLFIFKNIIPSSFHFILYNLELFPKHKDNISENVFFNNKIMTTKDCYWILNNIPYPRIVGENYKKTFFNNQLNETENIFSISNYNTIITQKSSTIKVRSGMKISQLLSVLKDLNKTIGHIPEFCEMSIGATITTQVHGNDFFNLEHGMSCFASCIKSYDLLFKDKIIHCEKGTNMFYNYLFEEPNNKYIVINVEIYLQDEYTLYKKNLFVDFYDKSINGILTIFNKHINNLIIPENQLTIQYNSDNPNILTTWIVTKTVCNNTIMPSYLLRRHVSHYLASTFHNIPEKETSSNILNQYKVTSLETRLSEILCKYNNKICMEILILYTDLIETLYVLFKVKNIFSLGIRFTIADDITKYKYNLKENQIICWVESLTDTKTSIMIYKHLNSKIITYHYGKFDPQNE